MAGGEEPDPAREGEHPLADGGHREDVPVEVTSASRAAISRRRQMGIAPGVSGWTYPAQM